MRQPSSRDQLLQWHASYMAGENPAKHEGEPNCGWYKMRMVKGGPWTPVLIWCDREVCDETGEMASDEIFRADVFGDRFDPAKIWTFLHPISKQEYTELYEWRQKNQHVLDSKKPVDVAAAPTLPRRK